VEGRLQGTLDLPLAEVGIKQAAVRPENMLRLRWYGTCRSLATIIEDPEGGATARIGRPTAALALFRHMTQGDPTVSVGILRSV
jgi:hypothetical protein